MRQPQVPKLRLDGAKMKYLLPKDDDNKEMEMGTCVVCGHPLSHHVWEGDSQWWRCHSLGCDMFQCECRLAAISGRTRDSYDAKKRILEHLAEMVEERKRLEAKLDEATTKTTDEKTNGKGDGGAQTR